MRTERAVLDAPPEDEKLAAGLGEFNTSPRNAFLFLSKIKWEALTTYKRVLIYGYCHGVFPHSFVEAQFRKLPLKSL